jgi:membrane-associated PAP2 superfamily phosphatase
MSEKLVRKDFDFTIADAENVECVFISKGSKLLLKFEDWSKQIWKIEFAEVMAFSWNLDELNYRKIHDDYVYEVENSNWIKKYKEIDEYVEKHKHLKFCFNADGVLDVIFEDIKINKE